MPGVATSQSSAIVDAAYIYRSHAFTRCPLPPAQAAHAFTSYQRSRSSSSAMPDALDWKGIEIAFSRSPMVLSGWFNAAATGSGC